MGIDLGTANTLVTVKGQGIVIQEPSVVAIDTLNNQVLAVGEDARQMIGRTPGNIVAIRPMREGVIADFDITEKMLRYFFNKARKKRGIARYRVVVGVPSGSTPVERRAVIEAARLAGAREAYVIEESMAAAIGAGLPVQEPRGSMVVDIGGGTTDVAVISLGGIVAGNSIQIAGDEMERVIIQSIRRRHNVLIGDRTAEELKCSIGSALPSESTVAMQVRGQHLVKGLPTTIDVSAHEIHEAIAESVERIVEAVKSTLEMTPPELMADIMRDGMVLAGGGALLQGMAERVAMETDVMTKVCDDPLTAVAIGTGRALDMLDLLKNSNALVS